MTILFFENSQMMQIPGTTPLSSVNPAQTQDLQLRLNQRVVAEVVEVAGTRVVLSVNGTPIVARLEASDAGAQLAGRKTAQFVVTSLANNEIELKLADSAAPAAQPAVPASPRELAFNVLEELGIEKSAANLLLARAAIGQRLQVTPDLLEEMLTFLSGLKSWGQDEAALAAAIKAAGLPLTDGVFQLSAMRSLPFGRAVTDLMNLFQSALSRNLPPEMKAAIQEGLAVLQRSVLAWGDGEALDTGSLRTAVETFGRTLENSLLAQLKNDGAAAGEDGLVKLANLRQLLQGHRETAALSEKLDSFLTGLERGQLSNVRPDPVPGQGEWCAAQFLLQRSGQQPPEFFPAKVRIARGGGKDGQIDGASTRLVIGVDVGPDETIQVDLTLVGARARALVITPDAELRQRSQEEMPRLIEGLRSLGIQVVDSRFAVGVPPDDDMLSVLPLTELVNRRVNIKI